MQQQFRQELPAGYYEYARIYPIPFQEQFQTFPPKPKWQPFTLRPCLSRPPIIFPNELITDFDDELEETCNSLRKSIVLLKTMEKLSERIEDLRLKKIKLDPFELNLNPIREWCFEGRALEEERISIQKEKEIINNELRDAVKEKKNLDEQLMKLNAGYSSLQRQIQVLKNGKEELKQDLKAQFNLCREKFVTDFKRLEKRRTSLLQKKRELEYELASGVEKQLEAQAQLNKLIAKDSELRFAQWTKTNFKSEKKEEEESLKHKFELFACKKVMLEGKLKLMRDLQQTPKHMLDQKFKEQIALYMIDSIVMNNDLDSLQQRNKQIQKGIHEAIQEINRIKWETAHLSARKNALEISNDERENRKSKLKEEINLIDSQLQLLEGRHTSLQQTFKAYRNLWKNFDD